MKKIALLFALSIAFLACETDSETINNTQDVSFELASLENNIGLYKGVFTTLDSESRATVSILVTDATTFAATFGNRAIATLTFSDGSTQKATANRSIELGEEIQNLEFISNNLTFSFSVNSDGSNPVISNAVFNNKVSDIALLKHSSKTPVTPITGTYICTDCMDHPSLNNGNAQTFNMMLMNTTDNTGSALTTQTVAGGATFSGTGTQLAGTDNGDGTENASFSGTITSVNSTVVTFNGVHTYGGFQIDDPECSGVDGTWEWATTNYGTILGSFVSDNSCFPAVPVTLYEDDYNTFEGTGLVPTPTAGQLDSNIIRAQRNTGATNFGDVLDGANNAAYAAGIKAPGSGGSGISAYEYTTGNRALGIQPSGSAFTLGVIEIKAVNTSASTLTQIDIDATVLMNNDQDRSQIINFSYSIDEGATFLPLPGTASVTTPLAEDTMGVQTLATIDETISGVSIAPMESVRFLIFTNDNGGSGSRDEIAFDDITISGIE